MNRLSSLLAVLLLSASPALAERVSVLVFDASGSMWNRVEGDLTRIEVARDVMTGYFGSRDELVPLSVIAYGHNRRGDCGDIEVIAPMGRTAPGTLDSRLRGLMPRGMTPLTDSLALARTQIPRSAEAADIILVTDGLETCGGDPCALAASLAAEGIDIRAHVVGFGLSAVEVAALSCITDQTGGMLFQTNSGAELADALQQVNTTTAEPAPLPDAGPEPVAPPLLKHHFVFREVGAGTPRGLMEWHAEGPDGTRIALGTTEGTQQSLAGLSAELPAGTWLIVAEGAEGRAERRMELTACCGSHGLPFTGDRMAANIPPIRAVQAGMAARIAYEITRPGAGHLGGTPYKIIATGAEGTLTSDQVILSDLITSRDPGLRGGATGALEPGTYRMVIALARQDGYEIIAERSFEAVENPAITIVGPDHAMPRERIELSLDGGYATNYAFAVVDESDRTIGQEAALYAGPGGSLTVTLTMPDREGVFDLVIRPSSHPRDRGTILSRRPITVGAVPDLAQGRAQQDTIAPVTATFRLPSGVPQSEVTWDAVPLDPDMEPEAWAPMESGPVISGMFEPGNWRVTARAPGEVVLTADVAIFPGLSNDFTVRIAQGGDADQGSAGLDGPWRVLAVPPRDAPAGSPTDPMVMLELTLTTDALGTGHGGRFTPTPLMTGSTPVETDLDSVIEENGTLSIDFSLPSVAPGPFVISLAPFAEGFSGSMASGPNRLPVIVWPAGRPLPALADMQDVLYGPEREGSLQEAPSPVQSMGCDEAICHRIAQDVGLEAQVPRGWMMWQVERRDGAVAAQFTNGRDVLMLVGAADWPAENGPCLATEAGALCYWSTTSSEAQIAAGFIASTLRLLQ
ncbi:MAG: vWA domain-containing protein [Pseudorhodobacter sp.]